MFRVIPLLIVSLLIASCIPQKNDGDLAECSGLRDMIRKMSLPHGMFKPRCYGEAERTVLLQRTGGKSPRSSLIVLVHGWGGDSVDTWGELPSIILNASGESSWLDQFDLLTYSFETGLNVGTHLQGLADQFGGFLVLVSSKYPQYRDIFLITHSMGGLLAQRAILDRINKYDRIVQQFRGNIYIAPPNEFLPLKGFYELAVLFERHQLPQMGLYSAFHLKLNDDWDKSRRAFPGQFDSLFCKNLLLIRAAKDDVVDYKSMPNRFCASAEIAESDRDHVKMVKITNPNSDLVFLSIATFLQRFVPNDDSPVVTLAQADRLVIEAQEHEEAERFARALELNRKAYKFYASSNDPTNASQRLLRIGEMEFLIGEFVRARRAFNEVKQMATLPRDSALAELGISSLDQIEYQFKSAEYFLMKALRDTEATSDRSLKTKVLLRLAGMYSESFDWTNTNIYLNRLEQEKTMAELRPEDEARRLLVEARFRANGKDEYARARTLCDQAYRMFEEAGRVVTGDALMCRAHVLYLQEKDMEKALEDAERARAIYKHRSAKGSQIGALELIGLIQTSMGQFDKAKHTLEEAERMCNDLGLRAWTARLHNKLGYLALRQSNYPLAQSYFTKTREFMEELAGTNPVPIVNQALGLISLDLGRVFSIQGKPSAAELEFTKAKGQFEAIPNYLGVFDARMHRISVNLDMGEMTKVRNDFEEAQRLLQILLARENPQLQTWFDLTHLHYELRNPEVTTLERLEKLLQEVETGRVRKPVLQGSVYYVNGQFARSKKKWPEAKKWLELASGKLEEASEREGQGWVALSLSEVYFQLGNHSAAEAHTRKARRIFEEIQSDIGLKMSDLRYSFQTLNQENFEKRISNIEEVLEYLERRNYRLYLIEAFLEYATVLCRQTHDVIKAKLILVKTLEVAQQAEDKINGDIAQRNLSEINRDGCQ